MSGAPEITREDAEFQLARRLYEEMERLDPSDPGDVQPWENLESRQRDYYRFCIRAVLSERRACLQALR
jgi:hypothetical protein